MKAFIGIFLFLIVSGAIAQEQAPQIADRATLEQAFDGAMTCSALTAIRASRSPASEAWLWENRSFAFGMLGARFWYSATENALPAAELDKMLNKYADRIDQMPPEQIEPFELGCEAKYADIDKLCEENSCPNTGPPAEQNP